MLAKAEQSEIENLPGGDLILTGLADREAGRVTIESCLVAIAAPRLRSAGLLSSTATRSDEQEPEITLYELLQREAGDAYSRYNSLLRRLVSFERSLGRRA